MGESAFVENLDSEVALEKNVESVDSIQNEDKSNASDWENLINDVEIDKLTELNHQDICLNLERDIGETLPNSTKNQTKCGILLNPQTTQLRTMFIILTLAQIYCSFDIYNF